MEKNLQYTAPQSLQRNNSLADYFSSAKELSDDERKIKERKKEKIDIKVEVSIAKLKTKVLRLHLINSSYSKEELKKLKVKELREMLQQILKKDTILLVVLPFLSDGWSYTISETVGERISPNRVVGPKNI
jgi:hypothetical protein